MPSQKVSSQAESRSSELSRDEGLAVSSLVGTAISSIRANLDRLYQHKKSQQANIVRVADNVTGRDTRTKDIDSDKTPDLREYRNSDVVKEVAHNWRDATHLLANDAHKIQDKDRLFEIMNELQGIRKELGDSGLITEVNRIIQNDGKYVVPKILDKEQKVVAEPEKEQQPPLTLDQQNVVSVASTMVGQPTVEQVETATKTNAQSQTLNDIFDEQPPAAVVNVQPGMAADRENTAAVAENLAASNQPKPVEKREYQAEVLRVTNVGDKTTINNLRGEVLFDFTRNQDGSVAVHTDKITNNAELNKQFQETASYMRNEGLDHVMADPTGKLQCEVMGDLAPAGSHAIAVSQYATDGKTVMATDKYTFTRKSSGHEVLKHTNEDGTSVKPKDQLIATSNKNGVIYGNQTPFDYAYMKDHYKGMRQAESQYLRQKAQAEAKTRASYTSPQLKSRKDAIAADKGGR
ncbi:MAG: hypothetical protein AAF810_08060 [Cyanobacteria bacterium P01_D01_bin.36]